MALQTVITTRTIRFTWALSILGLMSTVILSLHRTLVTQNTQKSLTIKASKPERVLKRALKKIKALVKGLDRRTLGSLRFCFMTQAVPITSSMIGDGSRSSHQIEEASQLSEREAALWNPKALVRRSSSLRPKQIRDISSSSRWITPFICPNAILISYRENGIIEQEEPL